MALRTPLSVTPHLYMGDSTGRPLDNGVVYFGEQDKDPEFYPIDLFSNDELTKPLAQPVHTKGGYLYDKGDMVEPHSKSIIYSVKVLDSYGRKVFYKGAMMRNNWNDDIIQQINMAILESQAEAVVLSKPLIEAAIEKAILATGFVIVDSFELGATITERNQALRHTLDGNFYRWAGDLPKVVPEWSTPASTGGMGLSAWLEVSDTTIRQQLSNNGGVSLIGSAAAEVDNLVALRALVGVRDTVNVLQHTAGTNLGGGTYVFELGSSKQDNNGTWVRADDNSGTWVLTSKLCFETFGVVNDGTDQSSKMQACIDFAYAHNIRSIFMQSKTGFYGVASPVVFKPQLLTGVAGFTNGYSKQVLVIQTNNVIIKPLADIDVFVVLRDGVKFNGKLLASNERGSAIATLVRVGLKTSEVVTYPAATYRHSSMYFEAGTLQGDTLYATLELYSGYNVYYTNIKNIIARDVGFAVRFNDSEDTKADQITRTQIDTIKHVGGACTVYGASFESTNIDSVFSEFINQTYHKNLADLPDSKPVIFCLKKQNKAAMRNHTLTVAMAVGEQCTRMVYSKAIRVDINGYYQAWEGQGSALGNAAFDGDFTAGLGKTVTPNSFDTLKLPTLEESFVTKPIAITTANATPEVVATLPNPEVGEFYGGVMYLPTTSGYNQGRVELAYSAYPATGWWYRTSKADGTSESTWTSLDRPHTTSYKPVVDKADINKMRGGALESLTYPCEIPSTDANSPTGGEFVGIVKWEGLGALNRGRQVAIGYYPNVSKVRSYDAGAFTAWTDLYPTAPVVP